MSSYKCFMFVNTTLLDKTCHENSSSSYLKYQKGLTTLRLSPNPTEQIGHRSTKQKHSSTLSFCSRLAWPTKYLTYIGYRFEFSTKAIKTNMTSQLVTLVITKTCLLANNNTMPLLVSSLLTNLLCGFKLDQYYNYYDRFEMSLRVKNEDINQCICHTLTVMKRSV